MSSKPLSPLKKVKRKVGYDDVPTANSQMKRLCLDDDGNGRSVSEDGVAEDPEVRMIE